VFSVRVTPVQPLYFPIRPAARRQVEVIPIQSVRFAGRPSVVPLVANAIFLLGSLAYSAQHALDINEGKPLISLTTLASICFSLGSTLFTGHAAREYLGHKPTPDPKNEGPQSQNDTKKD
jgi:hypothetical protein